MSTPADAAQANRGTAIGLGLALLVLGALSSWLGLIQPALDVWRAASWDEVPVTRADIHVMPFHGVVRTHTDYGYRAAGEERVGRRYAFVDPTRWMSEDALFAQQDAAPGTCFVDPSDPESVVLVRTLPVGAYRWRGAVVFALGLTLLALARASRTSAPLARALFSLPRAWSIGAPLLVALALVVVLVARPTALGGGLAVGFAGLAFGAWRRSDAALVTLAGAGVVTALGVVACAANPFALMDQAVDTANEPRFLLDYATETLELATLGIATALLAHRARARVRAKAAPA